MTENTNKTGEFRDVITKEFADAFLAAQRKSQACYRKEAEGGKSGDNKKVKFASSEKVISDVRAALHANGLTLSFGQDEMVCVRHPTKRVIKGDVITEDGGDTVLVRCWAEVAGHGGCKRVYGWADSFGSYMAGAINRHQSNVGTFTYMNRYLAANLMGATTGDRDIEEINAAQIVGTDKAEERRDAYVPPTTTTADLHDRITESALNAKQINSAWNMMKRFLTERDGSPEERKVADFFVQHYNPDTRGDIAPKKEYVEQVRAIATKYKLMPKKGSGGDGE